MLIFMVIFPKINSININATSGRSRTVRREGAPTPKLGQKPIIWQDFCRKLHENERNRTQARDALPFGSAKGNSAELKMQRCNARGLDVVSHTNSWLSYL